MKILILTGKFGLGHMKAALAIKEELTKSEEAHDIEIIDWIEYLTPHCARYIYGSYASLIHRNTFFYNRRYIQLENSPTDKKPEQALACYLRMSRLIREKQPDLIISVLAYCSKAVSYYKTISGCSVPLITCITDITGHSEWINRHTSAYAAGSEEVREFLIQKGVSEEQIFVTGIPVRDKFKIPTSKTKKRPKLLLAGGGLGILPKNLDFYKLLNASVPADITVITGNNQKLRQKLQGRFDNIQVLGYVDNMDAYLHDADLIVTKPGGITTFEAIHSETPIIALNPKLHQEKYNADFIVRHHIGEQLMIFDDYQTVMDIARFINNPARIEYCKSHMRFIKEQLEACPLSTVIHAVTHTYMLGGTLPHERYSFNF